MVNEMEMIMVDYNEMYRELWEGKYHRSFEDYLFEEAKEVHDEIIGDEYIEFVDESNGYSEIIHILTHYMVFYAPELDNKYFGLYLDRSFNRHERDDVDIFLLHGVDEVVEKEVLVKKWVPVENK